MTVSVAEALGMKLALRFISAYISKNISYNVKRRRENLSVYLCYMKIKYMVSSG